MSTKAMKSNDPCWCGSGRKFKRCHKNEAQHARIKPGRVSPMRSVPAHIDRPHYADTGEVVRRAESPVQPADVIERMRIAGRVAAEVLAVTGAAVRPGITTDELDAIAHQAYIDRGAYPSTLNYRGYPKSICTSVNEVICHGIPDDRPLQEGDIVNIDVTAYIGGVHGDTDGMFCVGAVDEASCRLIDVTRECLELGIARVRPKAPLRDVGRVIQKHAEAYGLGVVRAFVGHGIGTQFHTDLHVSHYDDPRVTTILEPGMTFTIEPMITMGDWRHRMWSDGWTAVTVDGSRAAQFEHNVVVTDDGVEILTLAPGD